MGMMQRALRVYLSRASSPQAAFTATHVRHRTLMPLRIALATPQNRGFQYSAPAWKRKKELPDEDSLEAAADKKDDDDKKDRGGSDGRKDDSLPQDKDSVEDKKKMNEEKDSKQDSKPIVRKVNGKPPGRKGTAMLVARLDNADDANNSVERVTVPDEFPQIIPIPLNKRPLFPGFYKSLHITDPAVIQAIHNLIERRRPYVGVFLTKDDDLQGDVVKNLEDVYRTGVFAQITNTYQTGTDASALTVVLYPHRRIRIKSKDLIAPPSFFKKDAAKEVDGNQNAASSKDVEAEIKKDDKSWMCKSLKNSVETPIHTVHIHLQHNTSLSMLL